MEYYRLGSAARKLHLSEDELWDFSEQGKLTFSAYVPKQVGTICNQELYGLGIGTLSGYTSIPKWTLNRLYQRKTIWIEQIAIEESHQIFINSRENPYKADLPNKYLKGWVGDNNSVLQSENGFFWIGLREANNGADFFSAFQFMIDQPQAIKESEGRLKLIEKQLLASKQLETAHIENSTDDLRVSETCLVELREILRMSDIDTDDGKRGFDKLIVRMMEQFPDHKPSQLWRMLKADSIRAERLYDIEEILDEVGTDELIWSDRHGKPRTLKKKSFYNLVDRILTDVEKCQSRSKYHLGKT
ncbi:hypothetical protein A5320_16350 [Rheinheimera sp. SA_1]|uniref:hypothetical protein n=1 Tax=Rheinheimera sp. SA_1 TaxID=1827365 RepID=UPI0007FB7219|nr:hypothetical protein [Rheinheimera sp. SA_1]OBP14208.1 hypothetical protein A5320_16350 [Rheinheimera sp. SA_1]